MEGLWEQGQGDHQQCTSGQPSETQDSTARDITEQIEMKTARDITEQQTEPLSFKGELAVTTTRQNNFLVVG